MSARKLFQLLCIGMLVTMCLSVPRAMPLDNNQPLTQTQNAPSLEKKLDLREIIMTAQDPTVEAGDPVWNSILDAMAEVDIALAGPPVEAGGPAPAPTDFSLYFPVKEHRLKWDGGVDLLVVSPPVDDNDVDAEVIAHSVADPNITIVLDRSTPPDIPTLVIGISEPNPERKTPPPPAVDSDGMSLMSTGTYVGLPMVLITNDSEPWWRGSPELYVKVYRWLHGIPLQTKHIDLGYVNGTYRWYWVGDHGALYFPFSSGYGNVIKYVFKEEDWPDGDDHMGTLYIYRNQLGLCSDYRYYANHYMRVFADLD